MYSITEPRAPFFSTLGVIKALKQACTFSKQHSRIMKTLLVTLPLAMLLMSVSALKCKNCIPPVSGGRCTTTTETCGFRKDACVSAVFTTYPFSYFRRCISMSDCLILQGTSNINAQCCQTDLCN
ncbi:hypothetical protein SRHO_G00240230 [Serrasalmus rhombeus]